MILFHNQPQLGRVYRANREQWSCIRRTKLQLLNQWFLQSKQFLILKRQVETELRRASRWSSAVWQDHDFARNGFNSSLIIQFKFIRSRFLFLWCIKWKRRRIQWELKLRCRLTLQLLEDTEHHREHLEILTNIYFLLNFCNRHRAVPSFQFSNFGNGYLKQQ